VTLDSIRFAEGCAVAAKNTAASMKRRSYISVEERRHHIKSVEGFAVDFELLRDELIRLSAKAKRGVR
jgi:hypothetical protein